MVIRQQEHRADARSAIPPGPEGPGFSRKNGEAMTGIPEATGVPLAEEGENLAQWMVFLGEQAQDAPRLVRAAGVMRDLAAENVRLRKALEWIAQIRHGLDVGFDAEQRAVYWSRLATEYRGVAARALGVQDD